MEIGDNGLHVEIDESMFVRRKGHVGRLENDQWVFGGICRETRECFLIAVPNRTKQVLHSLICQYIKPNTIIISDGWSSYNGICEIPNRNYKYTVEITL